MVEGVEVAERQIISFLAQNPEQAYQVSADEFISATAKDLHKSIVEVMDQGVPLTPQTLAVQLSLRNNRGVLDTQLAPLWSTPLSETEIGYFKKELARANALNQAKEKILKPLIEEGMSQQNFDLSLYNDTEEKIRALRESVDDANKSAVYTGKTASAVYREELEARSRFENFRTSGCSFLDRHVTMGFAPGMITTIFGPTGSGKTSLGLGLFMRQANKSVPAVYFTLEMTLAALMDRLFAMRHQVNISSLYPHIHGSESIPKNVMDQFEIFAESLSRAKNIRLVDESSLSMADIRKYVAELKREMGVDYLSVYIDLYSMLKEFMKTGKGSTADNIEACMNVQHSVAKELGVHFINVVQANRETDAARPSDLDDLHKLRPRLRNIKSSNAIAERSRLVIGVFRPKPYAEEFFPDDPATGEMVDVLHAIILKQNQGKLGEVQYAFNGEQSKLTRYVPPSEDQDRLQKEADSHLALARQDLIDLGMDQDPDVPDENS